MLVFQRITILSVLVSVIETAEGVNQRPEFDEKQSVLLVKENASVGSSIAIISVTDHENDTIVLSLDTSSSDVFAIDNTGNLTLRKTLDKETKEEYDVKVTAADYCPGCNQAKGKTEKTFYVFVEDINDNAPEFFSTSYLAEIPEDAAVHRLVIQVNATDRDEGQNGVIDYMFSPRTQTDTFTINNHNGEIRLAGPLDFEKFSMYTLFVIAQDKGNPPLWSQTNVIVRVIDVSDSPPVFLKATYLKDIPENQPKGTVILKVEAVDGDVGVGNDIQYEIIQGNEEGLFDIDTSSGNITVNGTLDAEQTDFYRIIVRASEIVDPSSNATAVVLISLEDQNDNYPQFLADSYQFEVREDQAKPGYIVTDQFNVRDADIHPQNRRFEYSLSGEDSKYFAISPSSGILTVNATLDFEEGENFSFKVFANETDTTERLSDVAMVTVDLINVNDHEPKFNESAYNFTFFEEVPVGFVIGIVTAADEDRGSYGEVEYALYGFGASSFHVESSNGTITAAKVLDYEEDTKFEFFMMANDGGRFFAENEDYVTKISVKLEDVNDNSPEFRDTPYHAEILENQTDVVFVFQVSASDEDSGDNGMVSYNITDGNVDGAFVINSSGVIMTTKKLDHEAVPSYSLTVIAYDHGSPSRNSTTVVMVTVQDRNDNPPVIEGGPYVTTNISEGEGGGTIVYTVRATDEDDGSNKKLTYAISAGDNGRFILNSNTGVLQISPTGLDREVQSNFNLTINVTDGGYPMLWDLAVLHVEILDINDNTPEFQPNPSEDSSAYIVTINEGPTSLGKVLIDVNATDRDHGTNADIKYSLSGDEHHQFQLDYSTGVLSVRKVLDRENLNMTLDASGRGLFSLDITATDQAQPENTRKSANVRVTVIVNDINDNSPQFVERPESAGISEAARPGSNVIQVQASDKDLGFAGKVVYNITAGDPNGKFEVTPSGYILVKTSLDAETEAMFNLTVQATDEGEPPRTNTTTVYITVDDVNDNDPKFNESSHTATVIENANITTSVFTVHATDDDRGENGHVSYEISSGNRGDAFAIDNQTGLITVKGPINREQIEEYSLTIQAEDAGRPSSRKAFISLLIRVLDENDNPPQFTEASYQAEIAENSPAGETVVPKVPIRATDKDEGTNAEIAFSLTGSGADKFDINSTTGVITTRFNNSLDRETNDTYNLNLIATDGGNISSSVPLEVIITDVNDELPRFSQQVYYANISEDAVRSTIVRRVTATDLDSFILNKEITYTSTGADAKFYINRATGDIIVGSSLDREFKSQYVLYVTAANIGENAPEGHCQVNITVTDVIDEKPYFQSHTLIFHISENASVGTNVTQLRAKDKDVGDTLSYFMDSDAAFRINQSTGVITTAAALDRENMTEHVLYVQAVDSVNLTSDRVKVVIKVDDVNDHAPEFVRPFYIQDYLEESQKDTSILTVSAIDADFGTNSEIRFSLVSNISMFVSIDPVSGQISQAGEPLNREVEPFFNFTVRATDMGSPTMSSEVNVSLQLVDINDNSPVFNQSSYQAYVMENQPIGTQVLVVTATDEDSGINARLSYGLQGGNFRFKIDQDTGNITTLKPLNREQAGSAFYTLTIIAVDGAIKNRQGTTQVTVTVLDDNDHAPVFTQANYEFRVSEDVSVGHLVGRVAASDEDEGLNAKITFMLHTENESLPFKVNETTGAIETTDELDREKNSSFTFVIIARDNGSPYQESNVTIRVVISDVNDNTPSFQFFYYNVSLPESTALQTKVVTVSATDPDEGANGQFTYSIADGDPDNHFRIDANSGLVTLLKILDHETKPWFNITIRARDLGSPVLFADTNLLITVLDVDDNAPVFHSDQYTASLSENATVGTFVAQVNATDVDADEEHKTIYYRFEEGNDLGVFTIGESNGTVFLNWSGPGLDREKVSSYTLTVAAISRVNDTELKSTVPMLITILDVNDETPKLPNSYTKAVVEDTAEPGVDDRAILTISAKDDDVGENSNIVYTIISGNEEGSFVLDNITGVLSKTGQLDRETTPFYSLLVRASDQGSPRLSNQTTINITILDANDNTPVIHTQSYFTIPENATVGTLITRINATDKDADINAQIIFSIISGNDDGKFILNETSGELATAGSLDYDEGPSSYKLTVKAKDHGTPALSSEKTITIALENLNDNEPTFVERQVTLSVDENLAAGAIVGTISASDADQSEPIFYYIIDGNTGNVFSLNETTGVLRTTRLVDRENSSQFYLYIKSSNEKLDPTILLRRRRRRALPGSNSNGTNTTQAPLPVDLGVQLVIVQIGDQNDNGPHFTKKLYSGGVSEDAKHGSNILQVLAIDVDEGNNSLISYEFLQSQDASEFGIDKETGWIQAKSSYAGKFGTEFVVSVIAKDNFGKEPYFNDTAEVKIYVLTDVQRAVIVSGRSPEFIRQNQDELKRILENITGYIINIDDINYYKDEDETYDLDRTAVLFHAVDPQTKKVVDKDVVINKIDENYQKHLKFFEEWKIKEVKAHVEAKPSDGFPVVLAVVIGLAILLALIVLIFCCVVCQLRKRQKRKLRAATAASYGGSRSANGAVSSIPTTNLHISEGSNPVWVDPYHNWGLKTEDEDVAMEPSPFYGTFHMKTDDDEIYEAQKYSHDTDDDGDSTDMQGGSRKSSNPPSPEVYESSPMTERRYFTNSEKYAVTSI